MKKIYYVIMMVLLCIIDQISKYLVIRYLSVGQSIHIIKNFFRILYVKNNGISFGMLSGMKQIIIIITAVIICYMIYEFIKSENKLHMFSVSLIISGALGNLIDRILRGYVIDFLSFSMFKHEFSIFNFADSLVTIGVLLYIFNMFKEGADERTSSDEE